MNEKTIQNARILIIDDTVANIALLQNMLQRVGYQNLRAVTDSQAAFAEIVSFEPDIVILDLMMPYVDGYQVLEILKTLVPKNVFLPVLVLTADTNPQSKRRALTCGASDFCVKPFDSTELMLRIRNLLAQRFLQMELQEQNQRLEEMVGERTAQLAERSQQLEKALSDLQATQRQMMQQERLRAFAEMAGGVAHDFSNALMSVVGYSDLLLRDPAMLDDRATLLETLQTINSVGRDAAHLVSRLREFYRSREESDVFVSVDLNSVVEQAVRITQPKWKDQSLAAGCDIQMLKKLGDPAPVLGNAAELREALTNLIFNAVDAMPGGGAITVSTARHGSHAVIEVRDTGAGMTEEVRARCIEPFFTTKGDKGTGLGLAQVFGIIRRHEGVIEIESTVGVGTVFRIQLPACEQIVEAKTEDAPPLSRSLQILVVDDEPRVRDVVSKYLESDGHKVVTASSGGEALERMMFQDFDLLVTDFGMPGMTGDQLADVSSQLAQNRPTILMSGFGNYPPPGKEVPAGIKSVLNKPISHSQLRAALVKAME